jgi:hypothetical protein
MTAPDERRTAYITFLRDLADMLETNPGVPLPYDGTIGTCVIYAHDRDEALAAVAAVQTLGVPLREKVEPAATNYGYELHVEIGAKFAINAHLPDVSERTVLGSKTVEDVSWRTPLGNDIPGGGS